VLAVGQACELEIRVASTCDIQSAKHISRIDGTDQHRVKLSAQTRLLRAAMYAVSVAISFWVRTAANSPSPLPHMSVSFGPSAYQIWA
jgi:hypothetical protein